MVKINHRCPPRCVFKKYMPVKKAAKQPFLIVISLLKAQNISILLRNNLIVPIVITRAVLNAKSHNSMQEIPVQALLHAAPILF
ncbi:hypothetical protein NMD15_08795 [Plesiomonas shigelloides]|uniref:hypothetical protein n=1 Tax=Plesiomonas shigelloides TaxID=703 RepID=UPI00351D055F